MWSLLLLSDLTPAERGKAAVISVAYSSEAHWRPKLTAAFDIGQPKPSQMEETSAQKVPEMSHRTKRAPRRTDSSSSNKNAHEEKKHFLQM